MKKKILCIIVVILMITTSVLPVFAVQPRWSYTNNVLLTIYFDSEDGWIIGNVEGYSNVTKIEGTITLYKKNLLGLWSKTGDKWNVSTSSNYLDIEKTFTAESGKQYKAELEATVYSGSNSETVSDDATGTCP